MTKILVLGSSHAGMLYGAKDILSERKSTSTDWLVTPGSFSFEISLDSGRVDVPKAYKANPIDRRAQCIGGREDGIHVNDYDVILYAAIGLRPVGILGWNHPATAMAQMPVSSSLADTMIRKHKSLTTHLENLRAIRAAGFGGQILCENWIRPVALPKRVDKETWIRFCDAERAIVDEELAKYDAKAVGHLKEQNYMTPADHVAAPDQAATHGNKTYAEKIVKRLLDNVAS